jgi:hypothetical protein
MRRGPPASGRTREADGVNDDTLEGFVALARGVVEEEARRHADDRWWILSPLLVRQHTSGAVDAVELAALRGAAAAAVHRGALAELPAALGERRVAVALHVDLALGEDVFAAIVLAVAGRMATACQYAVVERTDLGTPRLGPWQPGADIQDEVAAALRRLDESG